MERALADACAVVDATAGKHELVQMGFGPHAAYTVPPEGLRAIAAEARARDALLQVHLSETAAECQVVEERYGMSAPALLASEGVLEGRVLAAHAVWLDDEDLGLLAEHDVAVAHCPGSNGKLGSGIAPLRALLERGVRVGLGTDGPASNDDLHLWDEMRLAPLLARAVCRRSGRSELGRRTPLGHPRRRRGAGSRRGRARGWTACGSHPVAHR